MVSSLILALAALAGTAHACSNLLVTPGASVDGSSMISYNADSGSLYGQLYHYPAGTHEAGTMRKVYDWDSGTYLGEIPEASETYNVIGNMNEYGLSIGETTYGGLSELNEGQDAALIDYGSLIWITLQRSKTAREAVTVAGELMAAYGYASEGESFSIADPNEVWIMEIIGKGKDALGAVWVARKIPDGYVSGHANQARITTFPQDNSDECLYAADVVTFAQEKGYYPADAPAADFSFSDVYDPVTFEGARFCEARVWSFFGNVTSAAWASHYEDYALGYNLTNRMPLWVQPSGKLSVGDVQGHMRSHFEGTALTMAEDVGAEGYASPYRSHPLTWSAPSEPGNTYINERPIGTQQTGWNFVAQCRSWLPRQFGGVLWFGVDDAATTVRFPVYGCTTRAPPGWGGQGPQDGVVPPVMKFSMDRAFHVFNLVANWAYPRWSSIYPVLAAKRADLDAAFTTQLASTDATLQKLADAGQLDEAVAVATAATGDMGTTLLATWGSFFGELFVRFRDGYDISVVPDDPECGCSVASDVYRGSWYDRIVAETGDHLLDPDSSSKSKSVKAEGVAKKAVPKTKSKLKLKGLL